MTDDDLFPTGSAFEHLQASLSKAIPSVGDRLGRYTILEEIGTGGMGHVYKARRHEGSIEQTVALKVATMAPWDQTVEQRFRQEQQILADFDHPNITTLFDTNVTSSGYPYIVMELVNGVPITDYVRENALGIEERVILFKSVIDAIDYAHSRLVLHRDIKPTNVLVDADGRVKLLDFGIAKPINYNEEESLTKAGLILTPRYASPEQIAGETVTIASDVYQLGQLLYEILSDEPLRTSEQKLEILSTADVARTLNSLSIPAQLRAILSCCLETEPESRYRNAESLRSDLDRYLDGYPVEAKHASRWFRAVKFIQRNQKAAASGCLVALLLFSMTIVYVRNITEAQLRAEAEAQNSRTLLRTMSNLINDTFGQFIQASGANLTDSGVPSNVPIRTVLSRLSTTLNEFKRDDSFRTELSNTVGSIYITLEELDRAENELTTAFSEAPDEDRSGRQALALSLAKLFLLKSDLVQAERWFKRAQADTDIERSLQILAQQSLVEARIHIQKGEFDQAHTRLEHTLGLAKSGTEVLSKVVKAELQSLNAFVLLRLSELPGAIEFARASIASTESVDGPNSHTLIRPYSVMGMVATEQGNHLASGAHYQEALRIAELNFGLESDARANALSNAALPHFFNADYDQYISMTRESLTIFENILGSTHNRVARMRFNLCIAMFTGGRIGEAIPECEHSIKIAKQLGDGGKENLAQGLDGLGAILIEMGETRLATEYLEQAMALNKEMFGDLSSAVAMDKSKFAQIALLDGELGKAISLSREARSDFEKLFGEDSVRTDESMGVEGQALLLQGDHEGALTIASSQYNNHVLQYGANHNRTSNAALLLARIALSNADHASVENWLSKARVGLLETETDVGRLNYRLIELEFLAAKNQTIPNDKLKRLGSDISNSYPDRVDLAERLQALAGGS